MDLKQKPQTCTLAGQEHRNQLLHRRWDGRARDVQLAPQVSPLAHVLVPLGCCGEVCSGSGGGLRVRCCRCDVCRVPARAAVKFTSECMRWPCGLRSVAACLKTLILYHRSAAVPLHTTCPGTQSLIEDTCSCLLFYNCTLSFMRQVSAHQSSALGWGEVKESTRPGLEQPSQRFKRCLAAP